MQIREWVRRHALQPEQPLIPHRDGQPMTRSNVAERLALGVVLATEQCPLLPGRRVTPHTLRQSTATHLLQAGVDIAVIALWMGHENPAPHCYIEADLAMKERALAAVSPPDVRKVRYRPADSLPRFLESL